MVSLVMVFFERIASSLWEEYRGPMGLSKSHPLNASRSIPSPINSSNGFVWDAFLQAVSDAPAFLILPDWEERLGYALITCPVCFLPFRQLQTSNHIIS